MNRVDRFSLERHAGPYASWPARTRLVIDGRPSAVKVPGYCLLHQYDTPAGWLLVTDDDCPFEERTSFILLDHALQVRACRSLGVPYGSFLLRDFRWLADDRFVAVFHDDDRWLGTLRKGGIRWLSPPLGLRRLRT